jgi:hypothetical protein
MPAVSRAHALVLSLILVLATGVRVWGITFGLLNSDVRPDEVTMIQISLGLRIALRGSPISTRYVTCLFLRKTMW